MRSEKGITLSGLVIYVIIFSVTITLVSSLTSFIYGNLKNLNSDSISSEEFNKFHTYFVKDIKESKDLTVSNGEASNKVEIVLENGEKYTYNENEKAIYRGSVKVARNIVKFSAQQGKENGKNIVSIAIGTGKNKDNPNFEKNIKYVLKYW